MSKKVQDMFNKIAAKYDLINDVMSLGVHRRWRKKAVKLSQAKSGDSVLDCACGTGDFSFEFKRVIGDDGHVTGIDFSENMLEVAEEKAKENGMNVRFLRGDILDIPMNSDAFDISSIGFGIRNVDSVKKCLEEMARVTKSGGKVIVLEFGKPHQYFVWLYKIYIKTFMPIVGRLISKDNYHYTYLPETALAFPSRDKFIDIMNSTRKFKSSRCVSLTFGIAYIYIGEVE